MQSESAAQLKAEQARFAELSSQKAELASRLDSVAQENSGLKSSLQQEQEAAAESKVWPSVLKVYIRKGNILEENILKG